LVSCITIIIPSLDILNAEPNRTKPFLSKKKLKNTKVNEKEKIKRNREKEIIKKKRVRQTREKEGLFPLSGEQRRLLPLKFNPLSKALTKSKREREKSNQKGRIHRSRNLSSKGMKTNLQVISLNKGTTFPSPRRPL
jgi:hypothetical protein